MDRSERSSTGSDGIAVDGGKAPPLAPNSMAEWDWSGMYAAIVCFASARLTSVRTLINPRRGV